MPNKKRTPKDHRFAVEDLLDLYTSGHNSNGAGVKREPPLNEAARAELPAIAPASPEQSKQSAATGSG
jgi:hypothetical protein